jgi:hypothetical protein
MLPGGVFFLSLCVWDRASPCCPGWPRTPGLMWYPSPPPSLFMQHVCMQQGGRGAGFPGSHPPQLQTSTFCYPRGQPPSRVTMWPSSGQWDAGRRGGEGLWEKVLEETGSLDPIHMAGRIVKWGTCFECSLTIPQKVKRESYHATEHFHS